MNGLVFLRDFIFNFEGKSWLLHWSGYPDTLSWSCSWLFGEQIWLNVYDWYLTWTVKDILNLIHCCIYLPSQVIEFRVSLILNAYFILMRIQGAWSSRIFVLLSEECRKNYFWFLSELCPSFRCCRSKYY